MKLKLYLSKYGVRIAVIVLILALIMDYLAAEKRRKALLAAVQ